MGSKNELEQSNESNPPTGPISDEEMKIAEELTKIPFSSSPSQQDLQSDVETVNSFGDKIEIRSPAISKGEAWGLTQEMRAVIRVLQHFPSITKAAAMAGVDVKKVYRWRERHKKFRQASSAAMRIGFAFLEEVAIQRALEGSDYLLGLVLKGNNPKYKTQKKQKTINNITINAPTQGQDMYAALRDTLAKGMTRLGHEESS